MAVTPDQTISFKIKQAMYPCRPTVAERSKASVSKTLEEEGRGFESRRCQYKIVFFCGSIGRRLIWLDEANWNDNNTKQEAIRINLHQVAPSNNIVKKYYLCY